MDKKVRQWIFWFFIIWNVFLFYLLLTPGSIYKSVYLFEGEDKFVHAILFGVWTFCLSFLLMKREQLMKRTALTGFVVAILLAAVTELAQMIVPNRTAGFSDFFADAIGALIGIGVMFLIKKELNRT
ncbi:MAG: VanZ family protein [Cyclobacteriaceae bacterium]